MTRNKSGFLSALGKMFELFRVFVNDVLSAGGNDEDIDRAFSDASLRKEIVALILKAKTTTANVFRVTVDYSQSLAQMIQAGKYDWVNSEITEEHFPKEKVGGKAEFHLELLHFNKVMTPDQVLTEMKNRSLRPATPPKLLAFGEKYPEEQRKYPILALGSVWRRWGGGRSVPCLCSGSDGRGLGLALAWVGWGGGARFLAVRES